MLSYQRGFRIVLGFDAIKHFIRVSSCIDLVIGHCKTGQVMYKARFDVASDHDHRKYRIVQNAAKTGYLSIF